MGIYSSYVVYYILFKKSHLIQYIRDKSSFWTRIKQFTLFIQAFEQSLTDTSTPVTQALVQSI